MDVVIRSMHLKHFRRQKITDNCNEGQGEKTYTEIGGVYKKLQLFHWQDKAGFLWGDFFVIIISHLLPDNLFDKLYSRL